MYVCFALLLDHDIHNRIRKMVHQLISTHQVGIETALLPQHVSLKQSFFVPQMEEVEQYFDHFAARIRSFSITFHAVDLIHQKRGDTDTQVLWLDIQEDRELRGLHNRLNQDLSRGLQIPNSGFDGDGYHFHSTLAYGSGRYEEFQAMKNELNSSFIEMSCEIKEIAMFYSMDALLPGRFITHKILPLHEK
ncbi:2'-5' RNA ligase family protein [Paenibacillus sp. IB182496]|uniref:2'-5' RNA ligase family protein n=1 Tax=Paenibacillus sabuli TaxID=2772509 RepID=A0A927BN54_9BACL|nr:2'-5' RNA ligase family protein [Paenibacillus sabuli]MBD2843581.1 2'-5' RNA ligase family protein [Paenibacillus sabuli]